MMNLKLIYHEEHKEQGTVLCLRDLSYLESIKNHF